MSDHDRVRDAITEISVEVGRISAMIHPAIDRARIPTVADGFPRSASGADRSAVGGSMPEPHIEDRDVCALWTCGVRGCDHGGVAPTTEDARLAAVAHWRDEHGASIDYPDPTGEAAAARAAGATPPDPVARTVRSVLRDLERLATIAHDARRRLEALTTPGNVPEPVELWCRHHLTVDPDNPMHEPRHRGDTCRFCYDWSREHGGKLPPLDIIRLRASGRRVTQRATGRRGKKAAG